MGSGKRRTLKKSLTILRVDIVRAKTLAYEANLLADEMKKCTEFKVTSNACPNFSHNFGHK
jgi:hypothetical protein